MKKYFNGLHYARVFLIAISLAVFLFLFNLPPAVYAQPTTTTRNNTTNNINNRPNILEQIFSFITAPFRFLFRPLPPLAKPTPRPTPIPLPSETPSPTTQTTQTGISATTPATTVAAVVKSLNAGVTYIDLIGKTIIDSNGKIYPSNAALAATTKPSLGTSTNKFYGIFANNFEVSTTGDLTSKGKITLGDNSNTVEVNSSDWDISTGGNMTGIGTIGMDGTLTIKAGLDITTQSNEHLTLTPDGTGNLGIATSAPYGRMVVLGRDNSTEITFSTVGTVTQGLTVLNNGNVGIGTTNPSNRFIVSSGNTGIGATTADYTLDVWGTGRLTGALNLEAGLRLSDGSASSPSLTFISDTDTGLWRIGANQIALTTAGSAFSGLAINSSGNVGIGNTSPGGSLVVGSGNVGIGTSIPNATLSIQGNVGIGFTGGSQALPSNGLALSGNLGVGVTTVNSRLAIAGNGVFGAGYAGMVGPTNGLLVQGLVGIGTTAPVSALSVSGNVGIGGTSAGAAYNLEIWGTGRLTSALTVDGNLGVGASITSASAANLNTLRVPGYADLAGNVGVGASLTTNGLKVALGGIRVNGFSDLTGNVGIGTSLTVANQIYGISGLRIAGFSDLAGNVGVGGSLTTNGLEVALGGIRVNGFSDLSGNIGVGSSATVNGLTVSLGGLRVNGFSDLSGNVGVGGSLNVTGPLTAPGGVKIGIYGSTRVGPTNGLAVSGNVGIGVTTANSNLAVAGNQVIGAGFAGMTATANGLLVEGSVGIGISVPSQTFQVGTAGNSLVFTSGGNLGVGVTTPLNTLDVVGTTQLRGTGGVVGLAVTNDGRVGIGRTNPGASAALSVQGNVGIGTTSPRTALEVIGSGGLAALFLQGNVGIATTATGFNNLQVEGSIGIGTSYSAGTYKLDVAGTVRAVGYFGRCGTGTDATQCNQDVAEIYDAAEDVTPGDLVSISAENQKQVVKSQGTYDGKLLGIVSTSPGLLLGINGQDVALGAEASDYPKTADPRKPAVALSGKVPVKVVGKVNAGDYLTSSTTAGVAMKAQKSGPVVGQALSSYEGEGVGGVLAFVRLGYFNGTSISDLTPPTSDTGLTGAAAFSQAILTLLAEQREELTKATKVSEILTDRIGAGLEIITPQLTADTVIMGAFKPLEGKDLVLNLGDNQTFSIQNAQNQEVISFDNLGNATFAGNVVAKSIQADQIVGLNLFADSVITNKIASLVDYQAKQQASKEAAAAVVAGTSTEPTPTPTPGPALDPATLVKYNENGGLTVGGTLSITGESEFKSKSIFSALAEFISNTIFRGDVTFLGRAVFGRDAAGSAVVRAGADSVTVSFSRAYDSTPYVSVTPTVSGNVDWDAMPRYVVQSLSNGGFTIKLNKAASADITFSWTATAVSDAAQFSSTGPAAATTTTEPTATPAPTAEPTPQPTVEPSPSPSPLTPVETASPSAQEAPATD